jgi:hypothetical protein
MLNPVPGIVTRISSSKTSTATFDLANQGSFMSVPRFRTLSLGDVREWSLHHAAHQDHVE